MSSLLHTMILNLHAHWNTTSSAPFASVIIPIMNANSQTLSALIRSEIIAHFPETVYADTDIKSIKAGQVEKGYRKGKKNK